MNKWIAAIIGIVVFVVLYLFMSWRSPSLKLVGKFDFKGTPQIEVLVKNPAMTGAHWYGLTRKRPFAWYNQKKVSDFQGSRSGGFRLKGFGKETIVISHPEEIDGAPVETVGIIFRSKGLKQLFGGKSGNFVKLRVPSRDEIAEVPVPDYLAKFDELDPEDESEQFD